jgi:hypothetical protein
MVWNSTSARVYLLVSLLFSKICLTFHLIVIMIKHLPNIVIFSNVYYYYYPANTNCLNKVIYGNFYLVNSRVCSSVTIFNLFAEK